MKTEKLENMVLINVWDIIPTPALHTGVILLTAIIIAGNCGQTLADLAMVPVKNIIYYF